MSATWDLPGFEVDDVIGSGATAQVWRARELATGETVALKRLRPGADAAAVEGLRREAALLRTLDTPHLLRLRDVVGDVLVLDHAAGGSLAALLLRRGRLEPAEVVTVAAPIGQALAEAHARGIVHGDVSPANVLFTADGMPLLSDLGAARVRGGAHRGWSPQGRPPGGAGGAGGGVEVGGADGGRVEGGGVEGGGGDGTGAGGAAVGGLDVVGSAGDRPGAGGLADADRGVDGTAEYVDPAVAAGGLPDPASDVWALAALCHHALSGTPPHEGRSVDDVLAAAQAGSRAPLGLLAPHVPRALVAVVEGALAVDPSRRPTAGAFAVALQRAHAAAPVQLDGAPPAAPVPPVRSTHAVRRPPAEPPPPDRSRRRALPSVPVLAAVGAAAVLLVAGLGWAVSGGGPGPAAALPPVVSTAAAPTSAAPTSAAPTSAAPGAAPAPPPPAATPTTTPSLPVTGEPAPGVDLTPGAAPDWTAVLTALDRTRERAFATGDDALLSGVYTAGSPVRQADRTSLAVLTGLGQRATGVRHEVLAVEQLARSGDRVELRVRDVLAPQELLAATGAVLERRPGRSEASYDVVLVLEEGGWRIAELLPA